MVEGVTVTLAKLPGGLQCIAHAAPIPFERCMERSGCKGSARWLGMMSFKSSSFYGCHPKTTMVVP